MKKYCKIPAFSLLVYTILNVVTAVLSVSIAFIIELTINAVSRRQIEEFENIVLGTFVFIIMYGVFHYLRNFYMQKLMNDHIRELRGHLLKRIISFSFSEFRECPAADYLSILTNDIQIYQEGSLRSKLLIAQNIISAVIVVCALLMTNVTVAVLVIGCTAMIYMVPRLFDKGISVLQETVSEKLSFLTQTLNNNLEGFYVICTYCCQHKALKAFGAANADYNQSKKTLDKTVTKSEVLSMALSIGTELLILFVSSKFVFQGVLNLGEMVAVMQLTGAFVQPLMNIMTNLPKISGGKAVEKRFLKILETGDHELNICNQDNKIMDFLRELDLQNISFQYKSAGEKILDNISLKIEKGKKYAVTGESGAGKSTLINIMNGIYTQTSGNIYIDKKNVDNSSHEYINLFATVGQNTFLFNGTVKENIIMSRTEDPELMKTVCDISGVSDILQQSEWGLNEKIQDNGMNLSGGQKQKIALARALYHNKPILILDEATSAIDKKSAYDIEEKLLKLPGITLISITHDIYSPQLKNYDKIILVADKKVKMFNPCTELTEQNSFL